MEGDGKLVSQSPLRNTEKGEATWVCAQGLRFFKCQLKMCLLCVRRTLETRRLEKMSELGNLGDWGNVIKTSA